MQGLTLRTRQFALAALAVSALGLAAAPAQADAAALTLEASKRQLKPDKTTDLSGVLSGTFSSPSGKTVTLYATPYPYETEEVAGSTTTGDGGAFSFPNTDPALNTRYRVGFDGDVLDGDASSAAVQIFRFADSSYDLEVTFDGYAQARFDFIYSDQVLPEYYIGRNDVHWYFGKTKQKWFKRVERTRFFDTFTGVAADVRYRLPRSRKGYRFFFFPCIDAPAADIGIGNDKPLKCPGRIKQGRAARSYASATPSMAPVQSAIRP